jgi:hypothetical protein
MEIIGPYYLMAVTWVSWTFSAILSYQGLSIALAIIVLALLINVDSLRLRFRRLKYDIRFTMTEKIWISEQEAVKVIRDSDWAELKAPHITERRAFFELSALSNAMGGSEVTVSGVSDKQRKMRKFNMFLSATLRSFQRNNSSAVRVAESGDKETELSALNAFLIKVMDDELLDEFGQVPSITVT